MPEHAATQILRTTVVETGPTSARVELVLADATTLEASKESIVLSVNIELPNQKRPHGDYKRLALHRAVTLLREHSRPLDEIFG